LLDALEELSEQHSVEFWYVKECAQGTIEKLEKRLNKINPEGEEETEKEGEEKKSAA
jgi:hypothetical protein